MIRGFLAVIALVLVSPGVWAQGAPRFNPAMPAPSRGVSVPAVLPNTQYAPRPLVAPSPQSAPSPVSVPSQQRQTLAPEATLADPNYKLPQQEVLSNIDPVSYRAIKTRDRWEVTNGRIAVKDFGADQAAAEEFVKVIRDLRPTQWGRLGADRVVVEYGLTLNDGSRPGFSPRVAVNLDPVSLRVEQLRGVWVLRDDQNILLNFGPHRDEAEMAYAIIRKYGFNKLGQVGTNNAGLTYLFVQETMAKAKKPTGAANAQLSALQAAYQEEQLKRTGIDTGKGPSVGERIVFEPKNLEIRREKGDYVLAVGTDVLANFGGSEWSARDAQKLIVEQRFTEFCRFNKDVCFFLVNGNAPTRVPFSVQATRYDVGVLKVRRSTGEKYAVYEGLGRQLFACDTQKEAEQLVQLLQHYGFDQKCQLGLSSINSLRFLAKTGK